MATEIRPRCEAGDISPTYVDAKFSAAPTPMPVTNRQTDKLGRPVASAQPREPTPLITSDVTKAIRRPRESDRAPMMFEPTM